MTHCTMMLTSLSLALLSLYVNKEINDLLCVTKLHLAALQMSSLSIEENPKPLLTHTDATLL